MCESLQCLGLKHYPGPGFCPLWIGLLNGNSLYSGMATKIEKMKAKLQGCCLSAKLPYVSLQIMLLALFSRKPKPLLADLKSDVGLGVV